MDRIFRAPRTRNAQTLGIALSIAFGSVQAWAQPTGAPPPPPKEAPPPLPPEVLAQRPSEPPPGLPDPTELREQLALLYEFLSAPPEKLAQMRKTIEMIESMSAEDREFLRMRLVQLQEDAPTLQAEIAGYTESFNKEQRAAARQFWLSLREDERDAERKKLEGMNATERTPYLQQRVEEFSKKQAELRQRLQKPDSGPPSFIPPPPPFINNP